MAAACATLLANHGYSVALLERATFPREHVGESLLPASIPVLDVLRQDEQANGVEYLHDGEPGRIDCRFVVDASGQAALLSRKLNLRQWDEYFKNLAVYGYYRDAKHIDPPNDGNIFIESNEHGWLWQIPLQTGVTSVGAVVDKDVGQHGLRDLDAKCFLEAQVALAPHTRQLLSGAKPVDEPNIERDWSNTSKQFAGDGYVLVGDAACFVDPLFSSGVHLALGSATLAAAARLRTRGDRTG